MSHTVSEEELREQRYFMQRVRAVIHSCNHSLPMEEVCAERICRGANDGFEKSLIFQTIDHEPVAFTHSYGCQMNSSDGEKIDGMLAEMGFGFTDTPENADLILYNTCAVRENAENRVFGNIGALKHLKEKNPGLVIAVCGCMVQQEHIAARMRQKFPFVDLIFGTHVLHRFPELLYTVYEKSARVLEITESAGTIAEGLPVRREGKITASVPIMYGCDNFCSYCVVPKVRGRERSREPGEILGEVKSLLGAGYKEILLLGQNVNSYGKGGSADFAALLRSIDALDGEFLVSFMTSHPKDCTHELIDTIAASRHISHHLHLPVQSGSDRILKLMNRRYDAARYRELVAYAREKIPDLQLTTDLIVGFPGETYEDFCETLALIREVRFDSAYTFIYSRREGTKAAEMDDPISEEEKGKWFRELLAVQGKSGEDAYRSYVGKTLRVLCGGRGRTDPALLTGKSRQNIIVDFGGGDELIGRFVDVKITKALNWALVGEII